MEQYVAENFGLLAQVESSATAPRSRATDKQ